MKAIVLAAGKGTRLAQDGVMLPKVLRRANDRPLLAYVLDSVDFIDNEDITIVAGYMKESVVKEFSERHFSFQDDGGYGTGYAVMCGCRDAGIENFDGDVIILQGDVPLIKKSTIEKMYEMHKAEKNALTLLSCVTDQKLPFGRIIRGERGVTAIVEEKVATPEQKAIKELNVGLYILDAKKLMSALSRITKNEVSGEYYFTDAIGILCSDGEKVNAFITDDETEMWGVNTPEDLKAVEEILKARN
nr:NTP transferase domain-containing protein [Clostridia bacterium]